MNIIKSIKSFFIKEGNECCEGYLNIELFKDNNSKWRWRLVARNGEILATSEAYSSKQAAKETAKKIRDSKFLLYDQA
jgi:uncharacterized protein YegP (UPF0339 family)